MTTSTPIPILRHRYRNLNVHAGSSTWLVYGHWFCGVPGLATGLLITDLLHRVTTFTEVHEKQPVFI